MGPGHLLLRAPDYENPCMMIAGRQAGYPPLNLFLKLNSTIWLFLLLLKCAVMLLVKLFLFMFFFVLLTFSLRRHYEKFSMNKIITIIGTNAEQIHYLIHYQPH